MNASADVVGNLADALVRGASIYRLRDLPPAAQADARSLAQAIIRLGRPVSVEVRNVEVTVQTTTTIIPAQPEGLRERIERAQRLLR